MNRQGAFWILDFGFSRGSLLSRRGGRQAVLAALSLLLTGGTLLGAGRQVRADATPVQSAQGNAGEARAEYLIGVDDVINIAAVGHDDITQTVTVLSDGKIHVAGVDGDIQAEGMTLAQLKDRIYRGLDRLYNNLNLSVSIKESHSRNVTIVGTRESGQFPLHKGMRVSTLIALGGGLPGKTKLVVGSLIRDAKKIKLDIAQIAGQTPDPEADLLLQNNDTVILDMIEDSPPPTYSVLGDVAKPGSFPMPLDGSPITVARAIADAGGQTDRAALTRVSLKRRDAPAQTLNLYPLLVDAKSDSPEGKIELKDGDVLLFPEQEDKFMVMGQANKPGTYPMPETRPITVLEALSAASGPSALAEMRKATLVRVVDGKPTYIKLNLQEMMTKGDMSKNLVLQKDDILFIPTKGRQVNGSEIAQLFNPLLILRGLF